jgi:hypothetical protein
MGKSQLSLVRVNGREQKSIDVGNEIERLTIKILDFTESGLIENELVLTPDFNGGVRIHKSNGDCSNIQIEPSCSNEIIIY